MNKEVIIDIENPKDNDLVSREAVLKAVSEGCQEWRGVYGRCEELINALPSVNPQPSEHFIDGVHAMGYREGYKDAQKQKSGKWIPVSEKLPNDRDWYLGIFKEPDTGWINPFICDYIGRETKATTKEYWILRGFTDRDEHIDYYFNLECVAWMPLPKPYEPQERSDKE